MIPLLDEKVKKAVNSLTAEEISRETSFAFEHELVWYGIEALTHIHIMSKARDIAIRERNLQGFLDTYQLAFTPHPGNTLVHLQKLEEDNIFIPHQAYWGKPKPERKIQLFSQDYFNKLFPRELNYSTRDKIDAWFKNNYAAKLMYQRVLQPKDLENEEVVSQGIEFGKEIWNQIVHSFQKYSKEFSQPKKVTNIGNALIAYYDQIIQQESQ